MDKKNLLRLFLAAAVIGLMAAGGAMVISHRKAEIASAPLPEQFAVPVETISVDYGVFGIRKRALAVLHPKISADISARMSAYVTDIAVREGDAVRKGQVLARLDDREQRDRVDELSAMLSAARTQSATESAVFARDMELFNAKAISREALDRSRSRAWNARAEVTGLEKRLASARTALSYATLAAPFDGVVSGRFMDPGDLAMPGRPVLSVESEKAGFYLEIRVPQAEIPGIRPGDPVYVIPLRDVSGTEETAVRVSRIHPATGAGMMGTVEADIASRPFGLPSGAMIPVELVTCRGEGFLVPETAFLHTAGGAYLFSVSGRIVRVVHAGIICQGNGIAILSSSGLHDGMRLVSARESLLLRLHDGQAVNPDPAGKGW